MTPSSTNPQSRRIGLRALVCLLILGAGTIGMKGLASLKKPPAETVPQEHPVKVATQTVALETVQVTIKGYGEVKTLNTVTFAPEVSGRIVKIHPNLEAGAIIPAGARLFTIDGRDYQAALDEARATLAGLEQNLQRLIKQLEMDRQRLKTLSRSRDLSLNEFKRLQQLFEADKVGTRSAVDAAEQAYNGAIDRHNLLQQAIDIYPLQIQELRHNMAAARARRDQAQTRLERCEVRTHFTGRVKQADIEKGQFVTPGLPAVTLADDSVLEVHVPLDSREAAAWLRFNEKDETSGAWFKGVKQTACTLRWTEAPDRHSWQGTLDRVVQFNPESRTLTVAVRIVADQVISRNGALPLVEGMFCTVSIPGRTLTDIARLPRWSVSFDHKVFLAVDQRLKTVPVEVVHHEGEEVLVAGGLAAGDLVVTTRLVDPLENTLLKISADEK